MSVQVGDRSKDVQGRVGTDVGEVRERWLSEFDGLLLAKRVWMGVRMSAQAYLVGFDNLVIEVGMWRDRG